MLVMLYIYGNLDYLLSPLVLWWENFINWQLNIFLYRVLMQKKGGEFLAMLAVCNAVCFEL